MPTEDYCQLLNTYMIRFVGLYKKVFFGFLFVGLYVLSQSFSPSGGVGFFWSKPSEPVRRAQSLPGVAYAQDEGKFLAFGPYVPLSPGKYQISFTLKVSNNKISQPVALLEVAAKQSQSRFAFVAVNGTDFKSAGRYQDFDLQFETLLGERDFEFRITYLGGSKLWAEKITVTQLQSYSKEEAAGTNFIKGFTKNGAVTENFLRGSKQRYISIDDPMLSRQVGYSVSDSDTSAGKAWFVEPAPLPPSIEPQVKTAIKRWTAWLRPFVKLGGKTNAWLMFFAGFLTGCLLAVIGNLIYQAIRGSHARTQIPSVSRASGSVVLEWFLRTPKALGSSISRYLLRPYSFLVVLTAAVIASTFSENFRLFGFTLEPEILFFAYIVLLVIWRMNYTIPIVTGLTLLAGCFLLMVFGQEKLAEKMAVYAYYFFTIGVFRWTIKYVAEKSRAGARTKERFLGQLFSRVSVVKIRYKWATAAAAFLVGGLLAWAAIFQSGLWISRVPKNYGTKEKKTQKSSQVAVLGETVPKGKRPGNKATGAAIETTRIGKSSVKVCVLNGNGVAGEATRVAGILKKSGFDVLEAEGTGRSDYAQTLIRYKVGQKRIAELVAAEIASSYDATLADDLPASHQADALIVLGTDRKDSVVQVQVLNANGIKGEAAKVSLILEKAGFDVHEPKNAEQGNNSDTVIHYEQGKKRFASLVAQEIAETYPALQQGDLPTNSRVNILVILGRRTNNKISTLEPRTQELDGPRKETLRPRQITFD